MRFDVTAVDKASTVFAKVGESVDKLAKKLDDLGRKEAKPRITLDSEAARNRLRELDVALKALSNQRVRVDVDMGTARADVGGLRQELSYLRDRKVKVDVQLGTAVGSLTTVAAKLAALRDVKVKVGVDAAAGSIVLSRLGDKLAALNDVRVSITVELNPPGIEARLTSLRDLLRGLSGDTDHDVNINTDGARRSLMETILSLKLLAVAAASPIAIPGIFAATSSLLSLGGAAVSASGSLLLLPAAGAAGGAAMATLALGLSHVADALGPRGTPAQIKKVEEALAALSPAAREAVGAIRHFGPAFSGMRLEVQEKLFAGMAKEIDSLGHTYLPVLKTGLGGVAEELNLGAKNFTAWVSEGKTIGDVNTILALTRTTMRELAPAGTNVAAALTDIAVVGSAIMPELAAGATDATERFREFIAEARRTGELEQWIRGGLDTLSQLGQVASNTGGILGGMFRASQAAGADFLGSLVGITGALDDLINSAQGQERLTLVFRESQASVDAMLPGVKALASGVLELLANFSTTQGLQEFGALISRTAIAVEPLLGMLGTLAGETLGALAGGASIAVAALSPIVGAVTGIVGALGPVAPLAVAAVVAFKTFGLATAAVVGLGAAITATAALTGTLVAGLTGSLAIGAAASGAMTGLGAALGVVGRALPIVGVAAVALGFAVQGMTTSTDDAVAALAAGGVAADNMRRQLLMQGNQMTASGEATDSLASKINNWIGTNIFGIASLESSVAALERQRSEMTALQRAQADLTAAQGIYQQKLDEFGPTAEATRVAAADLAAATQRVAIEQIAARNATDFHTAAMIAQSDQALAAIDAGRGYEGALLNLERAQLRAAEATRLHGVDSLEAREANFALEGQLFATAAAAGEKARADGVASGAANVDQLAVQAQKDELLRLAAANTGPVAASLFAAAASMDIQAGASAGAEAAARAQKDELGRLAAQSSGGLAEAIRGTITNFDRLGGAHATAQEKARAQEQALRNLANMASGPVRDELNRMADQLRNIPDAVFSVNAIGRGKFEGIVSGVSTPGRLATGGVWGGPGQVLKAATGTVLPGYTPGRDVHSFASPTGGRLELSGGEAVMRPEWTRAVGPQWIHGANRAARSGGVGGVSDYIRSTMPAAWQGRGEYHDGGITPAKSAGLVQRFAFGGLVRTGIQPFSEVVNRQYIEARDRMADHLTPIMQKRIREMEAAAAAAAAAAGGPLGSGNGSGWQWQMSVLRQRFPGLPLISGFRPGAITATGNPSYHGKGRAVDVPPRMDVFNWIRANYGGTAREIIFSPANGAQIHNGRPHMYTGITRSNHFDHVHWAQKLGGILPDNMRVADRGGLIPSGMAALNLSGRAERMLSPRQTEMFGRLVAAISRGQGNLAPGRPLPVATPIGAGGNGMAEQLRAVMYQPRPSVPSAPRVDLGGVARQVAALRADLIARPQQVINQTVEGGPDAQEVGRTAVLALRLARR